MLIEVVFGDLPRLETERTILRKMAREDAEDIFRYCSDPEVAEYTSWHPHQSIGDSKVFIEQILSLYNQGSVAPWGIEHKETGTFIGTCGFVYWNIKHSRAELGFALSRKFWNQGIMTEVVKKLIEFGFTEMNLMRVEARCHVDNAGSAKVMEKSGMMFEGILRKHMFIKGEFQDLKLYAIINDKGRNT